MNFDDKQIQAAKRLASAAPIYQHFLKRDTTSNDIKVDYNALKIFLDNYAHARQGAAAGYREISKKTISEIFKNGKQWRTPTHKDAAEAWKVYKRIAKEDFPNIGLNIKRNPMNENKGVLDIMASKNISNIFIFVSDGLQGRKTLDVFDTIKSIRGVGGENYIILYT